MSAGIAAARGAALLLVLSAAAPAEAADGLARCAAIDAPAARLACYDSLAGRKPTATPPSAANAALTPAPAPAPSAVPVTSAPSTAPADANFGLAKVQRPAAVPDEPTSIQARVESVRENRLGSVLVRLDNGQTWSINEAEVRVAPGDAVTVERAALHSFLMKTPSRHSYRAVRVQ